MIGVRATTRRAYRAFDARPHHAKRAPSCRLGRPVGEVVRDQTCECAASPGRGG